MECAATHTRSTQHPTTPRPRAGWIGVVAAMGMLTGLAHARELGFAPAVVSLASGIASDPAVDASQQPAPASITLERGQRWFGLALAGARDGEQDVNEVSLLAQVTWFVDDRIEVGAELGVRWFDMDTDSALGVNPQLLFRWHFWQSESGDWSAFADAGVGMMFSTNDVPAQGTTFNFTPRVGVGVTYRISDSWRVLTGLRWSHVSNARTSGDSNNPASDAAMVYIGFATSF